MDKFQRPQVAILKIHNKSFPIYEGVNTVGRHREAIVNIKHLNVSQSHAVIVITNGNHFISDLNSSNGIFLENRKVDPFKLFELTNNMSIKLGDLCGTYISQGPFSNNDQNYFEMTQDVTQSFYGSDTQVLEITKISNMDHKIEDIHDAPTQEISWSTFKIPRSVKPADNSQITKQKGNIMLPQNTDSEEDIHNCETQVIGDPSVCKGDQSNKIKNGVIEQEAISKNLQTNNSAKISEDIHDATTQIIPLLSNNSEGINDPLIPESELFGPFNDEELPLFENNDNCIEIHEIPDVDKTSDIHEAVTQVMDISKKIKSPITTSNLEDDEATDCEDNSEIALKTVKANQNGSKEKHRQSTQDEVPDCEESSQNNLVKPSLVQKTKNNFLESDDDSNDSMEFFKVERSINNPKETINKSEVCSLLLKDVPVKLDENKENKTNKNSNQSKSNIETESSSEGNINFKKKKVCYLSSDSSTDDEKIGFRRKKKSSMIISTQDINSDDTLKGICTDDKKLGNEDSYFITDTDSETEIETKSKACLEESIPATQNQSTADLNDTDYIPATQEVTKQLPMKSAVKSSTNITDNANGSSEESFKLGLTELMINPSQTTGSAGSQDPCCSKSLKNPSPVFGEGNLKHNVVRDETNLDDTDKTDIYMAPTQQIKKCEIESDDNSKNLISNQSTIDIYLAPTQKIIYPEKPIVNKEKLLDNLNETEYLYDMPTQKMDVKKTNHPVGKKIQLDATDADIYFAPTQKVSNEITETDKNSSREESMDELYLQPTQQLEDIFNQPTQKVNVPNLEIEVDSDDENAFTKPNSLADNYENTNLRIKKKFSFKKPLSNLDGSLTDLLKHSPRETVPRTRKGRSSIELEFSESTNVPAETSERPSNPLSHILENSGTLDDTVQPKGIESETVSTNKIPLVNRAFSRNVNNKEEKPEKIIVSNEENGNIKDKHEIKNDNKKKSISLDNNVTDEKDIGLTSDIPDKKQRIPDSDMPTRSLRTSRSTTQFAKGKKLKNKTNSDLSKLEPQVNNDKNKSNKNKLEIKPRSRRTTRRLSSSSDTKTLDPDDTKLQVNADQCDNTLNSTNSDVNQSVAFLESKIIKTRKTMKSSEIQVKVPKSRQSMSISEIGDTSQLPEKIVKEKISGLNITAKKRALPKARQSEEREMKGINKSLRGSKVTKAINNNPETVKEEDANITNNNLEDTSSTSKNKVAVWASSNTRQGGKRKQLGEVKSDNSDTNVQSVDNNVATPKKQEVQPNRHGGKRKQPTEVNSDNSDTSIQSVGSNFTTPKKQKLQPSEALLNTNERGLRRQKPKVVFTMLESPQMESMIKQLGGSVIDSVDSCTVLLTEHVKRSQKLLSAVGLGKPICSPKWITASKKAHEFLDPWDYILIDNEAEKKWNFSLKESLNRSRNRKLLNSYNFQIQVTNAADVLKGAIESCGGKCISKIPSKPLENTFVISTQEHQSKYKRITKQHSDIKVIEPEAIFDGVLRQELRFSNHYLI